MPTSTILISGVASGIDWRSMVDQLIAVDRRPVNLVTSQKTDSENKLKEWQTLNTKLLALKTASEALTRPENFYVYTPSLNTNSSTVQGRDLLSVSTTETANVGSYTIKVTNLASAQKLSSNPFSSQTQKLGSAYAGKIIINGKALSISENDTLANVARNINALNSGTDPIGVTATVISYGANDYRLILTSETTGAAGISLLNGSSANLVQKFGWKDNQIPNIKNSITNGAQSDIFSNSSLIIKSLLGLTTGEASTGSLTIDGTAVSIDLSSQSLSGIKDAINSAMVAAGKGNRIVASVVPETVSGSTRYRLQIEGTQAFTDEKNVLNTLGILDHNSTTVTGKISANSMTVNGKYITADTLLTDIDGYISHVEGDNIHFTGTKTGGETVDSVFSISGSTRVSDLLSAIETQYAANDGDVVACLTADGKIRVDDMAGGGSLSVTLAAGITNGQLEFVAGNAAFGDASARQREIVAGKDASLQVDGMTVTRSSNTISDVLEGVTLNLLKEDQDTTVTLKIDQDIEAVKAKIQDFISKRNDVMSYINSQFAYDTDNKKTGGVLFGDGTLSSVKSDLTSILTQFIRGVNSSFSMLSMVGITSDKNLQLSMEGSTLDRYLNSNFNDIVSLFSGMGTTSSSTLCYISHARDSAAGTYAVHIGRAATQASETGSVDLSAGGAAGTLTITQSNSTATVTITSGMTLSDIENAINTELSSEYAQTLVGDQHLRTGGAAITAQTKWADIDGVILADDDSISFSGTNRKGTTVSGTYTIRDVNTGTIEGLLSAIQSAYSNDVTASIDTSGRIVLTDKSIGSSQISISIAGPVGKGLDFGAVDVTAGAGDGSQVGRYAMSLTATDDGSNHLVLRSNDYGSTSFTISQDTSDNNYDCIIHTTTGNTTASTDGAVFIDSSTTWSDLSGANVSNGDTITISGKARDGLTDISGTYTISNRTGDTVQDLLTVIQNAYSAQGTTVNAVLRDGKIYVEDTAPGASSIALTLTSNNEGGGSLNLGTFDQTTERNLDFGLINGTVSGQNVAGTINGEAATGSGQVLKGNSGNSSTSGLAVKYSGCDNNVDAGSITLTLGVAELHTRSLFNIIDPIEGYVPFKQKSIQDSISRMQSSIDQVQDRLERKQQAMIDRFVQMEMALSRIQSQSNWLSSQLTTAYQAWK
jgi:flagellar hook-associated protein 2